MNDMLLNDRPVAVGGAAHKPIAVGQQISKDAMLAELRRQVEAAGGVKAWCRKHGIESHSSVSLALSGKRTVEPAVANAAGFFVIPAEVTYMKMGG